MGLPEEQQRLIPRPPESMGDSLGPPTPSRWQRFKDCAAHLDPKRTLKRSLSVLSVLLVIVVLLHTFTAQHKDKTPPFDHGEPAIKHPSMDHEKLTWKPIQGCRNSNLDYANYRFASVWSPERSLTLVQEPDKKDGPIRGRSPHVSGRLVVRPVDKTASAGRVDIEVISNDEAIGVQVDATDDAQEIRVVTPRVVPWNTDSEGPCIQISIIVWAPQDATLRSLSVDTVHLDVLIKEGLGVELLHQLFIATVVGNVETPRLPAVDPKRKAVAAVAPYKLNAREIRINTAAGDVTGWFPLLDVLDIRTVSGDVSVDASPKPTDEERPRPAALHINSQSGFIIVDERVEDRAPDADLPARDYTVELSTKSGGITAKVAASSLARVHSQSGDLELVFLPVIATASPKDVQAAFINTEATSGDSHITVLEPLWTDRAPSAAAPALGALTSEHRSISGDISLQYPASWEGALSASSISGWQKVRGRGVEIDEREDNPWSKRVKAHKGEGKSRLDVKSVSGDTDILIGHV